MDNKEIWLDTLITNTPQEGRELAIKWQGSLLQPYKQMPKQEKLRSDYANDTAQLIASANVIAIEFQTVAAANNYWKN